MKEKSARARPLTLTLNRTNELQLWLLSERADLLILVEFCYVGRMETTRKKFNVSEAILTTQLAPVYYGRSVTRQELIMTTAIRKERWKINLQHFTSVLVGWLAKNTNRF